MKWEEIFTYNEATGNLIWKTRDRSHFKTTGAWKCHLSRDAGKVAGTNEYRRDGMPHRVRINFNGRSIPAHQIVWSMIHGRMHEGMAPDHIDGNPFNNRRQNLRPATTMQNSRNRPLRRDSTSGVRGASYYKRNGKWVAHIKVDGRFKHLGYHDTKGLAGVAHAKASIRYYGAFSPILRNQKQQTR